MPVSNTGKGSAKAPDAAQTEALLLELRALRRREAMLRDFVETSTISLHWVGADGTILWANAAELELLGYTREEYFGRNITEFHADEPVIHEILTCLSRGEALRDYPARLRHKDGSIRHVLINSSALFEDGKFIHTRCFTRDVTALREHQARQDQQAEATRVAASIGRHLMEPGTAKEMLGRCAGAFIEAFGIQNARIWTMDEDGKPQLTAQAGSGENDETCRLSLPLTIDGRVFGSVDFFSREVFSDSAASTLRQLTDQIAVGLDRKRAETLAREQERKLKEILEAIPAAVYTTDAEGRITFFNQAAVEFSGRVPELGKDLWCVTSRLYNTDGSWLPHDQCPMAIAIKEKRPVFGCEAIAERPDGTRRVFMPYPTPLFDADGRVTGGVNMLVDITGRKQAEQTLRESEERFRTIVDATPECVKLVACDGTLLMMNQAGLRMIEAAEPEIAMGASVYGLIAPEHRNAYREFNEHICHGGKGLLEYDIIGLRGTRRQMETQAAPLRLPDGSVVQLGVTRDISERRKAEENRALLGAIVDSSDDAIISKDLNGIITSWNDGAERMFGYTAEEIVGKPVLMLIPDDRKDEEPDILARLERGERIDHFETIRRRKDGELLHISLTISPIRAPNGPVIGASKIARDITQRKRNEEAINALNAQLTADLSAMTRMQQLSTRLIQDGTFSELLDEILDAGVALTGADMGLMHLMDKDGHLRIVAHRGFRASSLAFFGESARHAVCGNVLRHHARVIVDDVANSSALSDAARPVLLELGVRAVQSTPLVGRSGEVLGILSTHYRILRGPSGRDLRMIDILARQAADLIDRKRAEETRGQLSAIVEGSGDAIYVYDFEGTILTWNHAAEELYGYSADEIIGRSSGTIVPAGRREELRGLIEGADDRAEIIRNLETTRLRRDGSIFPALLTISPIRDESGKAVALSVIARDITERKRAEDELRQANTDLEQFAYSASHDLQEPLRTIKIYSELLFDRFSAAAEGESAEFLGFLRNAATRMELLVHDLLAYTQISRLEAPPIEVDTNEAVAEALANLGGAIVESGATVTSDPLPPLRVHSTHIRQLFQNLVGNAIKYRHADRAPAVQIGVERQDEYWVFTVRDNGIGIQPEFKEQIFGLFSRLHNTDRYAGTGIGLAICQRIVERYRGRIWVESQAGRGSEFRFALPV
jgi:PAS domain S-box-containing protein